jgi:hypothetical protein
MSHTSGSSGGYPTAIGRGREIENNVQQSIIRIKKNERRRGRREEV